ncbi:hypothetical protein N8I77_009094 [Diaporthe amygdali]|uniref:Uncharacterized protein n=1 Tax=Phomopsis amygdali TaxID=1214568 RepID=A0AAD9S8X2_PHOAM|nr:hypothetical protein N8I77_009094 [Diaporthe amygdali]
MEPPEDLQRNCTVSPRAESRSLACFILTYRGQARLTSTSPVCRRRHRHVLYCPPACAERRSWLTLSERVGNMARDGTFKGHVSATGYTTDGGGHFSSPVLTHILGKIKGRPHWSDSEATLKSLLRKRKVPVNWEPRLPESDMCLVHRRAGGAVAACDFPKGFAVAASVWTGAAKKRKKRKKNRGEKKSSGFLPRAQGLNVQHLHEIATRLSPVPPPWGGKVDK